MFKYSYLLLSALLLGCSQSNVEIPGFDIAAWNSSAVCSTVRMEGAAVIVENEDLFLGKSQPDIEALFGQAPRHELWMRNEKFFYYPLTRECEGEPDKSLFFRFNALGNCKEVLILLDD